MSKAILNPMEKSQESLDRDKEIEKNLGLVHSCAHKLKGRGIEYEDLYGAGCVGLCKAIDRFDRSRGLMFSTYAVPVILGEMRRLFRDGGAIKVSRSLKEFSIKVLRRREEFMKKELREPTLSELASFFECDVCEISQAISASIPPMSLTNDDPDSPGEIDIKQEGCEEKTDDLLALKSVLLSLEAEERKIIILRYFKHKTQSEVAKKLCMTQVQVSRKEKKILQKLKGLMDS